jgi:hypothetical protein
VICRKLSCDRVRNAQLCPDGFGAKSGLEHGFVKAVHCHLREVKGKQVFLSMLEQLPQPEDDRLAQPGLTQEQIALGQFAQKQFAH